MKKAKIESEDFYDANRIVDPDSPEGRFFQEYLQGLATTLLGNYFDPSRHQFRFLIADDSRINGVTWPRSDPPVIILTKGLLQTARSEDEIAGVLCHELGHNIAHQELRKGRIFNSKAEEAFADGLAVKLAADAGYNARGLEKVLLRIERLGGKTQEPDYLRALYDVHPLSHNRASTMEKVRIGLNRDGFKTDWPERPVPTELKDVCSRIEHRSQTDIPARAARDGHEQMSSIEKLRWIVAEAHRIDAATFKAGDEAKNYYRNQLFALFRTSKINITEPGASEALHRTFDDLTATSLWQKRDDWKSIYSLTLHHLQLPTAEPLPPVGLFRELHAALGRFIQAPSCEEALEAAAILGKAHHQATMRWEPGKLSTIARSLDFPTLIYPDKEEMLHHLQNSLVDLPLIRQVDWKNQLQAAGEDEKSRLLARALDLTHGEEGKSRHYSASQFDGYAKLEFGRRDTSSYARYNDFADLTNDLVIKDGRVAGLAPDPVQPENFYINAHSKNDYLAQEAKALERRLAWEESLLKEGVDWELLLTNPDQFIRLYETAIEQPLTSTPFASPFARELTRFLLSAPEGDQKINALGKIYSKITEEVDRFPHKAEFKNLSFADGKVVLGFDPDHPYYELGYRLQGREPKANRSMINIMRVDVYSSADASLLGGQEPPEGTRLAYTALVDKIRHTAAEVPSQEELGSLLAFNENLYDIEQRFHSDAEDAQECQKLHNRLQEHIEAAYKVMSQRPFDEQIEAYTQAAKQRSFLNSPAVEAEWCGSILLEVKKLDPDSRKKAIGALLAEGKFSPPSSGLRRELVATVGNLIVERVGKDNGTPAYQQRAEQELEFFTSCSRGQLRCDIISEFADRCEAQPALAIHLRDMRLRYVGVKLSQNDALERISESGLEVIKADPEKRAALIEFLSRPLSPASTDRFYSTFDAILAVSTSSSLSADDLKKLSPETKRHLIGQLHIDFWEAPLSARAVIINDVLFPPHTELETIRHTTTRLLDRILGDGDQDRPFAPEHLLTVDERAAPIRQALRQEYETKLSVDRPNERAEQMAKRQELMLELYELEASEEERFPKQERGSWVRRVTPDSRDSAKLTVTSYLQAVEETDPAESRLLIAALMAADHVRGSGEPLRTGQVLQLVLSQMGPAGGKLLQAIHSHPATPPDIRDDLKASKIDHDKPLRWEAIDLVRDAGLLEQDSAERVTRVGKILGAGSFGITLQNTAADGYDYADTFLRPRALAKATREFGLMTRAAQLLCKKDPRMLPVLDMIAEAEASARVETDMGIAVKQNEVATNTYDNLIVQLPSEHGPIHVTHHVAPLVAHNEKFKRVGIAQGDHFLDLEVSPTQAASAAAIVTAQLVSRFAGHPVDRDRHGGNVKVQTTGSDIHCNHFDFGMMELEAPSEPQKLALGRVVGQAVKDVYMQGGDFSAHLVARIDRLSGPPTVKQFLAGFKREILALGDYMHSLSSAGNPSAADLKGVLGIALFGDQADPAIQSGFRRELGLFAKKAESNLRAAALESGVTITSPVAFEYTAAGSRLTKEAPLKEKHNREAPASLDFASRIEAYTSPTQR